MRVQQRRNGALVGPVGPFGEYFEALYKEQCVFECFGSDLVEKMRSYGRSPGGGGLHSLHKPCALLSRSNSPHCHVCPVAATLAKNVKQSNARLTSVQHVSLVEVATRIVRVWML